MTNSSNNNKRRAKKKRKSENSFTFETDFVVDFFPGGFVFVSSGNFSTMSLKSRDDFFFLLVVVTFRGEKDIFRLVRLTMADLFLRFLGLSDLLFLNDCHRLGLDRS